MKLEKFEEGTEVALACWSSVLGGREILMLYRGKVRESSEERLTVVDSDGGPGSATVTRVGEKRSANFSRHGKNATFQVARIAPITASRTMEKFASELRREFGKGAA